MTWPKFLSFYLAPFVTRHIVADDPDDLPPRHPIERDPPTPIVWEPSPMENADVEALLWLMRTYPVARASRVGRYWVTYSDGTQSTAWTAYVRIGRNRFGGFSDVSAQSAAALAGEQVEQARERAEAVARAGNDGLCC